ncbi:DUF4136 domain-containing protein [Gramella lutea]|uniref:DUF4136 domain-containing protein n=1 Tax=Christiangramia lutea TaxID=1607951 RepID=A0A9X2A9J0_9FLAO|nr:DUF4136 domain-containing protein [Christiangramia lutea]MCH4821742.1 DUF4136 domain-containing protein [Christiangramia lutea]
MKNVKTKYKIGFRHTGMMIFLSLLLTGCYPDQPERVEDYDVSYTNYSPEFDFSVDRSYSLPERVILIDDGDFSSDEPEYLDDIFADAILNNIRQNLNSLGWTEVEEEDLPDVVMLPSAFDQTFLYYYDFGYWGWYYPGYFPGWGWYYPGYSPGYVSGYRVGTVLVQMTLPIENEDDEIPVVWLATFDGLLEGSDRSISERIDRNLDQAFSHPPFNN